MLHLTTVDQVHGKTISKDFGPVKGNTIRAKHLGKDIVAGLRTLVGGEIVEYTQVLTDARKEALTRMIKEAEKVNADAIIGIRFTTSQVMTGAAELLVFGTAVKIA